MFVRGQQFAPKFSIGVSGGGQIDRQAKGVPEAFKGTVKVVICGRRSNLSCIQVMELVHRKQKPILRLRRIITFQNVRFCYENNNIIYGIF